MGSSTEQEGHSLQNQWKLLTIKREKMQKCMRTCWQAFKLEVIRIAHSLWDFVKPTAPLHPSGAMKGGVINTLIWGKPRKTGREAASTSARTEIWGWCTAAVMNSAAHWSQTPSLSLHLSLHRGLAAHTQPHTHTHLHCLQLSSTT